MFTPTTQILIYVFGLLITWLLLQRLRAARHRQTLLLLACYVFYATWEPWFLAVLVFSSLMNFRLGTYLRRKPTIQHLWVGIVLNLLLLSFFKYLPIVGTVVAKDAPLSGLSRIVLPMGVSFWTFQALSYLFDLYREEELDPTLLEFCLYMAFWPTVLSGPICRLPKMLPQFRQDFVPTWDDMATGTQRVLVGVMMMAVAQVLGAGLRPGQGVAAGFAQSTTHLGGLDAWTLLIGYGFELFFDFCGYSHLVIGAARLFGFELHENFDRPYLSTSPSVFWTRWHMSLSFWIRDYVFFPLATVRSEMWWRNLSLVIAMFVFGLWHKGSILFMLWGIYHGLLLVSHRVWQQLRQKTGLNLPEPLATPISWVFTFASVSLGWIFFRAQSLSQAAYMLRAVFSSRGYLRLTLPSNYYVVIMLVTLGYFAVVGIGVLLDRQAEISNNDVAAPQVGLLGLVAHDRWVWVAPTVVVLSLYLFLLLRPEVSSVSPMLYRLF